MGAGCKTITGMRRVPARGARGDFAFGFGYGALDAATTADRAPHHHFPYARRLLLGWRRDDRGEWISDREDERLSGRCSAPSEGRLDWTSRESDRTNAATPGNVLERAQAT